MSGIVTLLVAYLGYLTGCLLFGGTSHYHTLDVTSHAAIEDIKSNYRRLARRDHPDKVAPSQKEAAQARFVKLQEAQTVLIDPAKRQEYDAELAEQMAGAAPYERAFFWASLWLWEVSLVVGAIAALLSGSDLIEALKNPARVALLQLIDTLTALPNTDVMLGHAR